MKNKKITTRTARCFLINNWHKRSTYRLLDGVIHYNSHALINTGQKSGDVSSMKFISPHDLACVTVTPEDVVFEDGNAVGLLKNLQVQGEQ